MTAVGFEPTRFAPPELESGALDRSAKLSVFFDPWDGRIDLDNMKNVWEKVSKRAAPLVFENVTFTSTES